MSRPGGLTLDAPGLAPLDLAEPTGGEAIQVRVFRGRPPSPARAAGPEADDWLNRLLGRTARLVWLGDPTRNLVPWPVPAGSSAELSFADGSPLLLANTASLDAFDHPVLRDAGGGILAMCPTMSHTVMQVLAKIMLVFASSSIH